MIEVVETFINPLKAIEKVKKINPQLVFLDINMPQKQGIDAASMILEQCPYTDIVFVTAYDQYAVEAFEVHALDYLLKPLSKERFHKTIKRVLANNEVAVKNPAKKLEIKCFGTFQVGWEGEEPIKWRTEKTKELFAFLLHHRDRVISKNVLLETLWFNYDVEKAVHQLHNGIYYIRKALKAYGIDRSLLKINGNYGLYVGDAQLDADQFDKKCVRLNGKASIKEIESLLDLYAGDYLEGEDWNWAKIEREKKSKQYSEIIVKLAEMYMENKEFELAEACLMKAYDKNAYDEGITLLILKLYRMMHDKIKAVMHFQEYEKLLKEELSVKPGVEVQTLYESFK
jgi:two-component SAPR family response regulator